MKKIISMLCALALLGGVAFAQNNKGEKVRAERIGFLTAEMNLTPEEAQAFWPVYNEIQAQRREAFKAQRQALKALKDCTDDKEAEKLLSEYLEAKKKCNKIDLDAVSSYKKVLPVQKVATLLLAEEKFRHQQIGKLGGGHEGGRPDGMGGKQKGGRKGGQGGPRSGGHGNGGHGFNAADMAE